jgi:CubicO group peptidase (beta-lactamase class C family)
MCAESGIGEYQNWRRRLVWGEVHDGNAYFLGGAAGHAGLFSTASEVFQLAQQFIGGSSRLLTSETCKLFRQNMTEGLEEARSLAWQLAATKDSTAGNILPPDSFGHTGFTGTSLWIDAEHARVFVLLTNRTHARELPFANINAVRREFHGLATAEISEPSQSHSDHQAG